MKTLYNGVNILQDVISEFYKSFPPDGNRPDSVFCPIPLMLFGTTDSKISAGCTVLSLSFGTHGAFRPRKDGRIVVAFADSDTVLSANVSTIEKTYTPKASDGILTAMGSLPGVLCGAEIFLSSEVGKKGFTAEKLCALLCEAQASELAVSPRSLLRSSGEMPEFLSSLVPEKAIYINPSTLEYSPVDCSLNGFKLVVATVSDKKKARLPIAFCEREYKRSQAAAYALLYSDMQTLGELMKESGADRLAARRSPAEALLYEISSDIADTTVLPDFSGTASLVPDAVLDDFIPVCAERYEKKTGTRPAFYISD